MSLSNASDEDPRGVIAESYQIEGLTESNARSMFLDWAMMDAPTAPEKAIAALLARFEPEFPDHPMTKLLKSGLKSAGAPPKRTGRRQK